MKSVFILHYVDVLPNGEQSVMLIGAYRTSAAARSAVERLKSQPGFCDQPRLIDPDSDEVEGFSLSEYELDKDHWEDGFVTMIPGENY